MSIQFEQITKSYHGQPVVHDVTLEIKTGEFFVLLGPSGSGKSTLLRAVAGLTGIDHGRISLHGRDVTHVPARERGVGLVFQHYALFRHMTVSQNVEFALRVRKMRASDRRRRREELLRLVALEGFDDRLPGQLSGGQQQRVAVARALAHEPAVLLLDEPFGALDARIRVELRDTIRDVQRRIGMTTILVTHDQEEAFALADRIGVMHQGRLLETGRPETLYRRPGSRFVATFLGTANLLLGQRREVGLHIGRALVAAHEGVRDDDTASEVVTLVRPEDIEIAERAERLRSRFLAMGHVSAVEFAGQSERLRVQPSPDSGLASAIRREREDGAATTLEILRTASEQRELPLVPGREVALGVRRHHVLATPISTLRIHGLGGSTGARLAQAALVERLSRSMQARILDDRADECRDAGLTIVTLDEGAAPRIASVLDSGVRRVLALDPAAPLPTRVQICCADEAARGATLALSASVLRHLDAAATLVSLQPAGAARSEVASSFRRLLDARAELVEQHGLDIRTDIQIGDLDAWIGACVAVREPALVVVGFAGDPREVASQLPRLVSPILATGSRHALLICLRSNARGVASQDAASSWSKEGR